MRFCIDLESADREEVEEFSNGSKKQAPGCVLDKSGREKV